MNKTPGLMWLPIERKEPVAEPRMSHRPAVVPPALACVIGSVVGRTDGTVVVDLVDPAPPLTLTVARDGEQVRVEVRRRDRAAPATAAMTVDWNGGVRPGYADDPLVTLIAAGLTQIGRYPHLDADEWLAASAIAGVATGRRWPAMVDVWPATLLQWAGAAPPRSEAATMARAARVATRLRQSDGTLFLRDAREGRDEARHWRPANDAEAELRLRVDVAGGRWPAHALLPAAGELATMYGLPEPSVTRLLEAMQCDGVVRVPVGARTGFRVVDATRATGSALAAAAARAQVDAARARGDRVRGVMALGPRALRFTLADPAREVTAVVDDLSLSRGIAIWLDAGPEPEALGHRVRFVAGLTADLTAPATCAAVVGAVLDALEAPRPAAGG